MTGSPDPAPLTLVCFPPAGGSAAMFRRWAPALKPHLAVRAVELPGRGRGDVPDPAASLVDAAESFAALVTDREPYALVGHSLGGLLAYEIAKGICRTPGAPRPRFVLVTGTRPPHRCTGAIFAPLLGLDDDPLLDALADLGAVNPVLRTTPIRKLFMPALRADLALVAGYRPDPTGPLPVDLLAWHGTADALAPPELGGEWERHAGAGFELTVFVGGHFFVLDRLAEVTAALHARHRTWRSLPQ